MEMGATTTYLVVDDDVTIGSSNADTLTLNATIAGNIDIEDRIRHVGDTDTQMRFPSADKISFEAGGVPMQLWNGNSSPKENVFNESGSDIDFRVETNGNANMLFISGGNDVVGIGAEGDLGVGLHVKSADSGASSVASNADELVVEGSGASGITILSANDNTGEVLKNSSQNTIKIR